MICTLLAAGACAVFFVQNYQLAHTSSAEAEEISLKDLIKRGPEGNPNVIVKDFVICEDYVVEKKLASGAWTKVWVPIVPADEPEPKAGDKEATVYVFIFSDNITNEQQVSQRLGRPTLRGLVNKDAPRPGILGSARLRMRYPKTDTSRALILEEGRDPPGWFTLGLLASGTVVGLGLTGIVWYLGRLIDKAVAAGKEKLRAAKQKGRAADSPERQPEDEE
jgi:hypothetical protein